MTDIKGYKVLTDYQKQDINKLKDLEISILLELKGLALRHPDIDKRWFSIARTHFEQACMSAVRAITKPETVEF